MNSIKIAFQITFENSDQISTLMNMRHLFKYNFFKIEIIYQNFEEGSQSTILKKELKFTVTWVSKLNFTFILRL
jgi:hypothetical protein